MQHCKGVELFAVGKMLYIKLTYHFNLSKIYIHFLLQRDYIIWSDKFMSSSYLKLNNLHSFTMKKKIQFSEAGTKKPNQKSACPPAICQLNMENSLCRNKFLFSFRKLNIKWIFDLHGCVSYDILSVLHCMKRELNAKVSHL